MLIIHHNDADGRCAAAIVALHELKMGGGELAQPTFFETDYKTPPPLALIEKHEHVTIVDFSYKPADMAMVIEKAGGRDSITWIDHHATAKEYGYDLPGLRDFMDKGLSGAELAWAYFHQGVPAPEIVELIGDYDAWRLQLPDSTALRVALESEADARDPSSLWWRRVLAEPVFHTDEVRRLVDGGHAMIRFRDGLAASLGKGYGFDTSFHGLNCRAVNFYGIGSAAIGNDEALGQYDAGLAFIYDGSRWTVSMYSVNPNVDCGSICKQHGGGGHKGAAGFVCAELPFAPNPTVYSK